MVQENEVVTLLLGVGVLVFVIANRLQLQRLPGSRILISGFYVYLGGRILTVLEGFFWGEFLNFLEHLCSAGSNVLVAIWCWRVFRKGEVVYDESRSHF
ncbi:MAG: hypothetical protein Q7J61_03075 [Deltaproteobacteria bacterium]|nr:hypothetical protein [Deltaproteobacteria bacterium]